MKVSQGKASQDTRASKSKGSSRTGLIVGGCLAGLVGLAGLVIAVLARSRRR